MPSSQMSLSLYISLLALAMGWRARLGTQSSSSSHEFQESIAVTCRDYSTELTGHASVMTILDIRNASGSVEYEKTESRGYQVSSSSFTEAFRSVETDFFARFGRSAEVSFGIPKFSGSASYELVMEFRHKMQTTFKQAYTENQTISQYTNTTVRGIVQPGQSLTLYQVGISMNGARLSSGFYNYRPEAPTLTLPARLSLNFGAVVPLLRQLGDTRPRHDNMREWDRIRAQYFWAQNQPVDSQVRGMLGLFRNIHPGSDNTEEWRHIRETSAQILETDQTYCHHTVRFFCDMLRGIHPRSDNKEEWARIRDKSNQCLLDLSR